MQLFFMKHQTKATKRHVNDIFFDKTLVIQKKCFTFAPSINE